MEAEKPVFSNRALRALIIPLVLEQILGLTVGMADSIMVSIAGEAAVSGVSLVDSINILLTNLFSSLATAERWWLPTGGGKEGGGGESDGGSAVVMRHWHRLIISLFSLVFNRIILGLIFGNVEADVMENAVVYFYLTALSFPFLGIYNASAALSRAMGNSRITMLISILMNAVNIIGNAFFIMAFHWGVFGVALPPSSPES